MAKKYNFRKAYFVCKDNSVFSDYTVVNCFKNAPHAHEQEIYHQRTAMEDSEKLWNKNQPVPVYKAHGFYLVHESLFDEILKDHSK